MTALRVTRSMLSETYLYSTPCSDPLRLERREFDSGPVIFVSSGRSWNPAAFLTVSANFARGGASSTSPHSTLRFPRTPSAIVEKTSAKSRRTFRLSTKRVRPPVPGSTPSSGASGRLTALDPSSAKTISSHAMASSYPPSRCGSVQCSERRNVGVGAEAFQIEGAVSFVNLQKFTLNACVDEPSM